MERSDVMWKLRTTIPSPNLALTLTITLAIPLVRLAGR
jgi:hypothetical protein